MKEKILVLSMALVLAAPLAAAKADNATANNNNSNAGTLQEKRQQILEKKQEMEQQRCKNLETRIDTRVNRYGNSQNRDIVVYDNLKSRLNNLVERLKLRGLDTSKLETDLKTLDDKTAKIQTDYGTFIASLKDSQNLACGESQGQFAGKLGEARKVILTVRQDRLDIRNFLKNTIRPDILALRDKLKNQLENKNQKQSGEPSGVLPL